MTLKNKHILITSGPTWVPIDDVRVISNKSSGLMGRLITKQLVRARAKVTMLEGAVPLPQGWQPRRAQGPAPTIHHFHYFSELHKLLREHVQSGQYDIVIHAAAVSDYSVENPSKTKISSKKKNMTIHLKKNPKLIHLIKKWDKNVLLVGFKLESNINDTNLSNFTQDLLKVAKCDLIVANSLNENTYQGYILDSKKQILTQKSSRQGIAQALGNILKRRIAT